MAKIGSETVGFALAEVCRTSLGFAGGRLWLQFEDPAVKEAACACAMGLVERGMTSRHQGGIRALLDELSKLGEDSCWPKF